MTCICVLGMHRSGTSCLTGIMQSFGVELGEVFTENAANKRGNRENSRIVELNEALLEKNSGAWYRPVVVSRWSWLQTRQRKQIISQLQANATGPNAAGQWGFKDTRTLFTLDFWLEGIAKTHEEVRFIGTFRHPHRVALSLHKRDNAPIDQCWELWHTYNTRLYELAKNYNFPLVDFDLPADAYLEDVLTKLIQLGLNEDKAANARKFFDADLRNQAQTPVDTVALPAHVTELYQALQDYNKAYQPLKD
jgi:hypothetical protein